MSPFAVTISMQKFQGNTTDAGLSWLSITKDDVYSLLGNRLLTVNNTNAWLRGLDVRDLQFVY